MKVINYREKFIEIDGRFSVKNTNTKDFENAKKMFYKLREWVWYGNKQIRSVIQS